MAKQRYNDKDIVGNGKMYSPSTCIFVTPKVNAQNSRQSKLDYRKVYQIRNSDMTKRELAYKYNVSITTISDTLLNKIWVTE